MEFLKEILGEELYKQFEEKINAHNGNEANKDKQIKLANLSSGEYVGKGKYDALDELLKGKTTELDTANGLIAELKKGTKGNEELQGKITGYETQVADLQKQLAETKIKSAIKVALLSVERCTISALSFNRGATFSWLFFFYVIAFSRDSIASSISSEQSSRNSIALDKLSALAPSTKFSGTLSSAFCSSSKICCIKNWASSNKRFASFKDFLRLLFIIPS